MVYSGGWNDEELDEIFDDDDCDPDEKYDELRERVYEQEDFKR